MVVVGLAAVSSCRRGLSAVDDDPALRADCEDACMVSSTHPCAGNGSACADDCVAVLIDEDEACRQCVLETSGWGWTGSNCECVELL